MVHVIVIHHTRVVVSVDHLVIVVESCRGRILSLPRTSDRAPKHVFDGQALALSLHHLSADNQANNSQGNIFQEERQV